MKSCIHVRIDVIYFDKRKRGKIVRQELCLDKCLRRARWAENFKPAGEAHFIDLTSDMCK